MTFPINSLLLCWEALAAEDRTTTANPYLAFTFKLFGSWHRFEVFVLFRFYIPKWWALLENVVFSRDPRVLSWCSSWLLWSPPSLGHRVLALFYFTTSEISGLPQPFWYIFWQGTESQVANYFQAEDRPLPVFLSVEYIFCGEETQKVSLSDSAVACHFKNNPPLFFYRYTILLQEFHWQKIVADFQTANNVKVAILLALKKACYPVYWDLVLPQTSRCNTTSLAAPGTNPLHARNPTSPATSSQQVLHSSRRPKAWPTPQWDNNCLKTWRLL